MIRDRDFVFSSGKLDYEDAFRDEPEQLELYRATNGPALK